MGLCSLGPSFLLFDPSVKRSLHQMTADEVKEVECSGVYIVNRVRGIFHASRVRALSLARTEISFGKFAEELTTRHRTGERERKTELRLCIYSYLANYPDGSAYSSAGDGGGR